MSAISTPIVNGNLIVQNGVIQQRMMTQPMGMGMGMGVSQQQQHQQQQQQAMMNQQAYQQHLQLQQQQLEDSQGGTYLCSKCGQRKRGHTCTAPTSKPIADPYAHIMIQQSPFGMSTRSRMGSQQNQQTHYQQQLQQQEMNAHYISYVQFLEKNGITSGHFGGKLTQALSSDQKKEREKKAADFNMTILFEKQEKYPYYFDPHTKTFQIISSWEINVANEWQELPNNERLSITRESQQIVKERHNYLQQQDFQELLQANPYEAEQKKQREFERYIILKRVRDEKVEEDLQRLPQPKNNIASFFHYLNMMRDVEKKDKPDMALSQVAKLVAQKWKNLSEDEKQPFHDKAMEDKVRYEHEKVEYNNMIQRIRDETPDVDINQVLDDNLSAKDLQAMFKQDTDNKANSGDSEDNEKNLLKCDNCNQIDQKELLLTCSKCNNKYHGIKCLNLPPVTMDYLKHGNNEDDWRCTECKACEVCNQSNNDEKLIICDVCDKEYHTYCLTPQLSKVPPAGWRCSNCVYCVHCFSKSPGPSHQSRWKSNYTSCESCYSQFGEKKYCVVCRVQTPKFDPKSQVQCIKCERTVHTACDNTFASGQELNYKCPQCKLSPYTNNNSSTTNSNNNNNPTNSNLLNQPLSPNNSRYKPVLTESELLAQQQSSTSTKLTRRSASLANANLKRKRDDDDDDDVNIED